MIIITLVACSVLYTDENVSTF